MEEMTIGQARDGFSALIARLLDGSVSECVIKNRSKPVARIVPIAPVVQATKRPFGIASAGTRSWTRMEGPVEALRSMPKAMSSK